MPSMTDSLDWETAASLVHLRMVRGLRYEDSVKQAGVENRRAKLKAIWERKKNE